MTTDTHAERVAEMRRRTRTKEQTQVQRARDLEHKRQERRCGTEEDGKSEKAGEMFT